MMPLGPDHRLPLLGLSAAALLVGLAISVTSWGGPRTGPELGRVPPSFALRATNAPDRTVSLESLRGTPVVVELFASWCTYCEQASRTLADAARAPRRSPVAFVGVSLDEHAFQAEAIAREWRLPYDVVHDNGWVTRSWHVSALPTIVVLDAEGRVRYVSEEAVEQQRLERWLRQLGSPRTD